MAAEPVFSDGVARAYDETRALPATALLELPRWLGAEAGIAPGARVLDAGAGTGLLAETLERAGCAYVGVDAWRPMLQELAQRRARGAAALQADLRALPLATGAFDAVLALRVFGVVPGWRRGVAECLRVLKPGGRLVVGRVERAEGSLHAVVRDLRNAWLSAHSIDAERPGAGDAAVLNALASVAEPEAAGEPIRWTARSTPRAQIGANLSGWRVQALDADLRAALAAGLGAALAERFGDLDATVEEPAALALHVFRKPG